jgi:hypothetical protein
MHKRLIAAALSVASSTVSAAPMVYLTLEGRPYGSSDPYSTSVQVNAGGSVEYQIVLEMAPIGTSNTQTDSRGTTTTRTINYWTPPRAGLQSTGLDLFESAADSLSIDFATTSTLNTDPTSQANDSWAGGTGANGGTVTARSGSPDYHDLIAIRPILKAGVFSGIDPQVMLSGIFSVSNTVGGTAQVQLRMSTTPLKGSGAFAINSGDLNGNSTVFMTQTTEAGPDPYQRTPAMTVTTVAPEPTSPFLIAAAGAFLARRPRRMASRRPGN